MGRKIEEAPQERFYRQAQEIGDCLIYTGGHDKDGYGQFWYVKQSLRAHRVAYIIAYGYIPEGMQVLHTCDNPSCVKPDHLFLGTNADNLADMVAKGRSYGGDRHHIRRNPELVRGENSATAKINWAIVREIRANYNNTIITRTQLASEYKLSKASIDSILANRNWHDPSYKLNRRRTQTND